MVGSAGRSASDVPGLLGLLAPEDRADLLAVGRHHRYRQGAHIVVQGDHRDTVFVLLDGRVKITLDTPEGREIVLAVDGPGDLLGEFEAIDVDGGPRTAGNIALEPVECLVFTGDEFRGFLDAHPRVAVVLLRWIIHRLQVADRRRAESGSLDVAHRLARFLVELGDQQGRTHEQGMDIEIPLTQEELASLIAASRDSVVRALTSLRNRGLITTARRKLTITDVDGLRRYANVGT